MKYYILSGRDEPCFLVDEKGAPAVMDTLKEARESARRTPMCQALGYVILAWDEHGFVGVEE